MKRILTLILGAIAALSCSSNLEPELVPQTQNQSEVQVQSVELSSTSLSLLPGEKVTLTATVAPSNATDNKVAWTSSDDSVATVSYSGEVTAVSPGFCIIFATCGGKRAGCDVAVIPPTILVESVSLDKTEASMLIGESLLLNAVVLPEDASDKVITWASSDTDVATVENGNVSALAAGEATVTATAGGKSATCRISVRAPFNYGGMCLEAISDGTIVISNPLQLSIDYKIDENDWITVEKNSISIPVNGGEKVWFRGLNDTYAVAQGESSKSTIIRCDGGDFFLYGNLMSLVSGDDYDSGKALTGEFTFFKMFSGNGHIINHPIEDIELPATTISPSCYRNMFYGCAKLTRAPKLPAKVLTEACYASMFAYCSSLKELPEMSATDMAEMSCAWMMMGTGIEEVPEMPAMNLARSCYEFMFSECTELRKGPSILPATQLAVYCYAGMFQRCGKLESAPVLPATVMAYSCYSHMFNGCASLDKAPKLPALELAEACYQRMFGNSGLTEAPELPATNLEVMCYQHMFEGSIHLEKAPILPALQLESWCYANMFQGCRSLNYVNAAFLTGPSTSYTMNWLEGVAREGVFVKNPVAIWDVTGPHGVPEGWTIVK